jgi:hypothetical protein
MQCCGGDVLPSFPSISVQSARHIVCRVAWVKNDRLTNASPHRDPDSSLASMRLHCTTAGAGAARLAGVMGAGAVLRIAGVDGADAAADGVEGMRIGAPLPGIGAMPEADPFRSSFDGLTRGFLFV